ncbi:MAG: ATP-dependent DNA helicase RecQ [Acidobacteria bacterium]|nr:MAG: ATP-dependent DNA helicase RecQ [Acidobacteriota bacterium]
MEAQEALHRYWGYEEFRPLQQRVIASLMASRDVCVIMPTGGGKSLCYQLPAALQAHKTAVVISPLVALMQDQVAQLGQVGIPAAMLNSSQSGSEQVAVRRGLQAGKYRLLYISPERLAREDTFGWLQGIPISLFAIDEAHCISEWGHEFRPEYRQLGALRARFPEPPIAAFTASATRRVRHDILAQLHLRDPEKVIASFHRANLRYVARQCTAVRQKALLYASLRHLLQAASSGSVIVYAPTIARVEETAAELTGAGIAALPYHGKMEAAARRTHQERWMEEEVRVLVGTLAFGLGINKANVRAVIHLALPKSIEQYYQEAGRAGRDGAPADCLLLWQKRDAGLLAHFAQETEDPDERERVWQRFHEIRNFVTAPACRHRQICTHFGERWTLASCGACDVCGYEPEYWTAAAKPSAHVVIPPAVPPPPRPDLLEALKAWRRQTAHAAGLPAYMVLHDATLEALCHCPPRSLGELRQITGFGEVKVARYGEAVLGVLGVSRSASE